MEEENENDIQLKTVSIEEGIDAIAKVKLEEATRQDEIKREKILRDNDRKKSTGE